MKLNHVHLKRKAYILLCDNECGVSDVISSYEQVLLSHKSKSIHLVEIKFKREIS